MTPEYGWDDFIVRDGRSRIGTPRWGDASVEARATPERSRVFHRVSVLRMSVAIAGERR